MSGRAASLTKLFSALARKAELGDALLVLYVAALVRQYFWFIDNNAAAWIITAPVAALVWLLYVATKEDEERASRWFWLFVALPLFLIYSLRFTFPDLSFDVLNYRLLHSERALRGQLLMPGDFFPTAAPYNPAPDLVTGIFRRLLGYRLGTIVNLFAVIWAARVADKMLRPFVARPRLRALCVLLVVLAEHLLFEVNTYMVDLLAVPLLLEATRLALRGDDDGVRDLRADTVRVAFLVGLSVALKLTNVVMAAPIVLLCAWRVLVGRRRIAARKLPAVSALSLAAFLAPLVPFGVYLYMKTGNPVFPLANALFKSPFWPTSGGWDARWGPSGVWETLLWPVLIFFKPERHSELAVYSGRLGLGFVAAACGLLLARRDARVFRLCLVVLAGCLLWSAAGMGYSRYGLYLEVLAGLVVVALASVRAGAAASGAVGDDDKAATQRRPASVPKLAAWAVLVAALAAQATLACSYTLTHEWGMRHTALTKFRDYKREARHLLRDYTLPPFLAPEERERFAGVGAWVEGGAKTSGVEALLNSRVPVIGARYEEFLTTREARREFVRALDAARGGRVYSLCFPEDSAAARKLFQNRGLEVVNTSTVSIPFFSPRERLGMILFELSIPAVEGGDLENFWQGAAFDEGGYRAEIVLLSSTGEMKAGTRATLRFRVTNNGRVAWPARGSGAGSFQVNLGNRWLDASGTKVVNDMDGRAALPADLQPGASVELSLGVTAPKEPGDYILELDMVHEGVTWFYERGSKTLRLLLRVVP